MLVKNHEMQPMLQGYLKAHEMRYSIRPNMSLDANISIRTTFPPTTRKITSTGAAWACVGVHRRPEGGGGNSLRLPCRGTATLEQVELAVTKFHTFEPSTDGSPQRALFFAARSMGAILVRALVFLLALIYHILDDAAQGR